MRRHRPNIAGIWLAVIIGFCIFVALSYGGFFTPSRWQ